MASQNLTPHSPKQTSERRCRRIAAELDWKDCDWPDSGTFRDVYWSAKFDMSLESLRELVHRMDIPHIPVGKILFVDSADMLAAFPKVLWSEVKAERNSQKKRKPTDGQEKKKTRPQR